MLASSSVPPFLPGRRINGRPVIDGGVVESVPLGLATPGADITAILTRMTPWHPLPPTVRVLAPPEDLGIAIWDYANPRAIERAYDLGRRAGDRLRGEAGVNPSSPSFVRTSRSP